MLRAYKLQKSSIDDDDVEHKPLYRDILPVIFDLTPKMPPVLDQRDLGACASHACSNTLRYLLQKEGLPVFQPSRLYIYYNTRVKIESNPADQDTGVTIKGLCKAVQKYDACDEELWLYDTSKFAIPPPLACYKNARMESDFRYEIVPQDIQSIRRTLASGFPIIVGMLIYESLESDTVSRTGIVPLPNVQTEKCLGGHAMLIVGYDEGTFKIMNSWGYTWGNNGFCNVPAEYITDKNLTFELWAIYFFK
jgi:C1A family cysteine protease